MSEEKKTDHFLSKCPVREKRSPLAYQGSHFIVMLEFTLYFSFFFTQKSHQGAHCRTEWFSSRTRKILSFTIIHISIPSYKILDNFSAAGSLK